MNISCSFKLTPSSDLPDGTWRILFGVVIAILAILAIIGNGITSLTMILHRELRTQYYMILLSLSISDLLTGMVSAPLYSIQFLSKQLMGNCYIEYVKKFSADFLIASSVMTLALIAYHRYSRIQTPLKVISKKVFVIITMSCWLIAILLCIFNDVLGIGKIFLVIRGVFLVIVFIVTCVYYFLLVVCVRKWQRTLTIRRNTNSRRKTRTTISVVILLTCFYILFSPSIAMFVIRAFKLVNDKVLIAKVYTVSVTLCFLNSTINPLIYYINVPKFKRCLSKSLGITSRSS